MPHLPGARVARVALLRAVNLGSHQKLPMADLRDLLADLGFTDPRTLLQTGNVVFGSRRSPARLETELEAALADRLGLETDVVVRTAAAFSEAVERRLIAGRGGKRRARGEESRMYSRDLQG